MYKLLILFVTFSTIYCQSQMVMDLLNKMTIEDKCGQMTQVTFDVIQKDQAPSDPDENPVNETRLIEAIRDKRVGSILNTPYNTAAKASTWVKIIQLIQDTAKKYNLKVPVIYGLDSIHGANYIRESTLFPQPLGMAASFNLDIVEKVARITSMETRAIGVPWNFNPVLDVGRQPLWPRLWETYGEDTYLAVKYGEAYVKAHQGTDLKNKSVSATCMKHYIGYSYPFNGKDRTPAYIPENILRETFLPTFEAAVKAGSPTVMINSGEVNGVPGHINSFYINDILKGELKFDGFVVSDWEDIVRLHIRDGIAETPEEAVRMSVMAGLDMSMVPFSYSFFGHCVNLAKKDAKFLERATDATKRILKVKDQLGLFDNADPVPGQIDMIGSADSENFNLEAAKESIILAKNDGSLPLNKLSSKKILVTGPTGNLVKVLNGGWSYTWQGENENNFNTFGRPKKTLFKAIQDKVSDPANVKYVQGVDFNERTNFDEAIKEATDFADIIILAVGEDTYTETPGNIDSLLLNHQQYELANQLFKLNKQVIVVYIGGRPRVMTSIDKGGNATLIAFLPGNKGGEAIAEILFGDYNPNGKLPITYPIDSNGITTYDYKPLESFDVNKYEPLYPFGHGLSYTKFEYSNLKLSSKEVMSPNSIQVEVTVKNVGARRGKETVLLYLNDEFASNSRPIKQLKGFKKVDLMPSQETTVTFVITNHDMSFVNNYNKRIVEPGHFNVYVGHLEERFLLKVNQVVETTTTPRPVTTTTTTVSTAPNSSISNFRTTNILMVFLFIIAVILN